MSQRVGEETARSEQLESALSEYLRPTDLEDAEERENEDPNMYYETLSGKSVVEENIEKNMKSSKTSHKEFANFANPARSLGGRRCFRSTVSNRNLLLDQALILHEPLAERQQ